MASAKSEEVLNDMIQLSVDVIKVCEKSGCPPSVIDQVIRSVSSIGANFAEAQDAASKKDFINKIYIAKKEASETKYWLAVLYKLTAKQEYNKLSDRIQRFIMMLQKIINSSKGKQS